MGPHLPDHRKDDSSESDEDGNIRHDRFRSERFQDARTDRSRIKEDNSNHGARNSSRRHRDRSPLRSHSTKHKRISSPFSSSHRSESRNNHDRKDWDRESPKKDKKERSSHNQKCSDVKSEKDNESKKNKNKLSCLLKNFDKQLESKRNNLENESDIGPALPPHLRHENKDIKESRIDPSTDTEAAIGPTLLPLVKTMPENTNENSNDNDSDSTLKYTEAGDDGSSDNKNESEDFVTDGPILPPNTSKQQILGEDNLCETQSTKNSLEINSQDSNSSDTDINDIPTCSEENSFGPALPPKIEPNIYGPVLPPKIEFDSYGPALPPNFKKDIIKGPTLPSGMTSDQLEMIAQEESNDEDIVGPLPEGKMSMTQYQLDLRAMQIKRKLEDERNGSTTEIKKREEWMLELPPEKATNLGLGPRSFRMRAAPDMSNRSGWTDTPADKLRKEEQALSGEAEPPVTSEEMVKKAFIKERDEVMDKMSQLSRDEDRADSLLALHQKKLKKKKKKDEKEGKNKERRPFDRNVDLQVNRFDEAQKKAIFKKAQLLDTRFSTGESKYL